MYGQPEITEEQIKCEICGRWFQKITSAHLKLHGLTIPEYKEYCGFSVSQPLEAGFLTEQRREYNKAQNASERLRNHPGRKPFEKGRIVRREIREQERLRLASMAVNVQHTDSFRQKISESSKKNWEKPEYREKSLNTYKKIYNTPEMKKKMSEKSLIGWSNPEQVARLSKQRKELWNTPEKKQYASERSKKAWAKRKGGDYDV